MKLLVIVGAPDILDGRKLLGLSPCDAFMIRKLGELEISCDQLMEQPSALKSEPRIPDGSRCNHIETELTR